MTKEYPRRNRVEELAREVLSEAIQELRDPRIGFVTVTSVKVSPDLRTARVYVSALGEEEARQQSIEAIQHAVPHLRSVFGEQVRLRYLPRLEILEDTTAEYGSRIETLLREAGVSKAPEVEALNESEEPGEPGDEDD
jgi:ribosome-binding factor A